jgi:hypothetical protein
MQNIVDYIKTRFRVIILLYYNNPETKLQKLVQIFDNVEAYGEFVQAEFQETTIINLRRFNACTYITVVFRYMKAGTASPLKFSVKWHCNLVKFAHSAYQPLHRPQLF